MMNSIVVGRIIEVTNSSITVRVDEKTNYSYKVVLGFPIRIGGVGNFVKVDADVYEIVSEKQIFDNSASDKTAPATPYKILICNIIGFFEKDSFKQGSRGYMPNILDCAYTVTDRETNAIYANANPDEDICCGEYLFSKNTDFYIDINKFFASHTLIVGNTGSGKSNTLNTIYSQLFLSRKTNKSKFLIIDTNGEYANAFTNEKSVKCLNTAYSPSSNEIKVPISSLSEFDWKLLLEATEKTQFPIIKKLCHYLEKRIYSNSNPNIANAIFERFKETIKTIIQSNFSCSNKYTAIMGLKDELNYYSGEKLYKEIIEIIESQFENVSINNNRFILDGNNYEDVTSTLLEKLNNFSVNSNKECFDINDFGLLLENEHLTRVFKYNASEQNTSPMISRFNSNKKHYSSIFSPFSKNNSDDDLYKHLFSESNILVCDVTKSNKDIRRIMVTFMCSKLYEIFANTNDDTNTNESSLHLIIDEAHNYLSSQNFDKEDAIAKTCIETFERIIKEGRKFGVFLTMATQRPSDITPTLLSQAHNYVIHKLVNPKDIEIIKNTVPFIDSTSMKMLSVLSSGQAIFTGTAFNRPNIVQVLFDSTDTKVKSDTIKLDSIWEKR